MIANLLKNYCYLKSSSYLKISNFLYKNPQENLTENNSDYRLLSSNFDKPQE